MSARSRSLPSWRLALWLVALCSGCPERSAAPPAAQQPCMQFGQRCEVSPGKLGTCVKKDDCAGSDCYICQSQH